MNQKTVGLTSRAAMLALAFIMVAGLALLPLDGVAYAQTAAPANLQAVARPDGSAVDVSWGAVADADSYQLYKRVGEGAFGSPMSITGTTYADTAVSAGMTYGYYVRAVVGGANGAWSSYASATVPGGASRPTAAPANLTVTADGLTAVDISWGAVTGAATYSIYRWDGTAGTWIHDLTGTSHKDTGLTAGTYSYNIRAVNAAGTGPWSGYQSVALEVATEVPQLSLTHEERGEIELDWTDVANAQYELQRRKSDGTWARHPGDDLLTASEFLDSGVGAGTYIYRVRAVVDNEAGPWSNEKSTIVPDTGRRPGTPAITSATPTGTDTIVIDWRVNAPDNATSYNVQWKSGSQDWSTNRQTSRSTKSYTRDGLSAATEYTFRVQAVNVNGASDWSNEESATTYSSAVTNVVGRLGPPQGVKIEDKSTTGSDGTITPKLKVSWSKVKDATHYQVYMWMEDTTTPADSAWGIVGGDNAATAKTSYEDTSDTLAPGMTYSYVVRAVVATSDADDSDGLGNAEIAEYGEWSDYAMGTTKAYKPGTPTLSAEVRGGNAIWLAWEYTPDADSTPPEGSATGYQLQYRRSGSSATWSTFRDVPGGMKNYFHQNLSSSRTYFYRVRAMNGGGYGPWSEVQEKKIPSQAKPGTPTGVEVMDASIYAPDDTNEPADADSDPDLVAKLKVSWNQVTGATGYEVQRWTMMEEDGEVTWMWKQAGSTNAGNKTSVTVDGLMAGTAYHFVVRALNGGIAGDWSRSMYGTTKQEVPDAPTLKAETVGEKMIRLSWTKVSGADSYQLGFVKKIGALAAGDRRPEHYTVIPVDGVHYTHGGRAAGTAYDYRVRAVLPAGVFTDWSAVVTATTRPARPGKFSATEATPVAATHNINLKWNPVEYDGDTARAALAADNYEVQRREEGTTTWSAAITGADCTTDTTVCTLADSTDLDERSKYHYRLRARGATDNAATNGYWVYTSVTTKVDP